MTTSRTINVEYFAILREQTGCDSEVIRGDLRSPADLYASLSERYMLADRDTLKVAVNDEFSDWDAPLNDGDTVVFIPPVAGG